MRQQTGQSTTRTLLENRSQKGTRQGYVFDGLMRSARYGKSQKTDQDDDTSRH
jgi:hypothetical protein